MLTLCLDTSHIFLTVCLIKDDQIVYKYQEKCWKRQSEEIFPVLLNAFDSLGMQPEDLDCMVISEGPGSRSDRLVGNDLNELVADLIGI